MTDKQRFLVYVKLGFLIADIRKKNGVGVCKAISILYEAGVIQKLENLQTGFYLESGAYLSEIFAGTEATAGK